ncbi:MAG: FG-GAP-like repeat-containing protein [Pyrinomonadaceae bacterium]
MNTNYISIVKTNLRQIISAVCLSTLLFVATALAQTPLRANGKIAFTSDRDGNREIYVMNPDGTNQTRLTNNSISDDHPAWSPDGRKLAFISQRPTGQYAVFQMNADGAGRTEITPVNYQPSPYYATGWTISWSPDGRQLAFTNLPLIYIVNADGSGLRTLTSGYGPAWSPDGSKILFITGSFPGEIHTIRPDGSDLRTLPALPAFYNWYYDVTWSPTGTEIAITAFDGANEIIFISNADGTNPREFYGLCAEFTLGCSRLAAPSWSPDGNTIVFFAWGFQSGLEIYVKDIAGGESRRLTNTTGNNSDPSWQPLSPTRTFADFDGDGRSDVSVFRPSDRVWYLDRSRDGFASTQFGLPTDKITPADFDGDGKTDISVYRDGTWYWLSSSNGNFNAVRFGISSDIPVPADYTGDGRAELAVYRGGVWYTLNLTSNLSNAVPFGLSTDEPVPADYDGDGRIDHAVYRDGEWHLNRSTQGYTVVNFGLTTDKPVIGDYDGDGKADEAVYRDGTWYLLRSSQGFTAFQFGLASDVPAPADYDGDGKADAAVYRNGTWYVNRSTGGVSIQQFGLVGDKPAPAAFLNY